MRSTSRRAAAVAAALLLPLVPGGPAGAGVNLLANPGFESGNESGWNRWGNAACAWAVVSSPAPRSGLRSFRLTDSSTSSSCGLYQDVSASPGQSYVATTWVNLQPGSTAAQLYLDYLDSFGARINVVAATATATGWRQLTASGTAPAGTATARVWFYVPTSHTADAYFDDATLENTTPVVSPPSAPRNVGTSIPAAGQVRVMWAAPASTGGATITAYRIYAGGTSSQSLVATVSGSAREYVRSNVEPGQQFYRVAAVNSAGEGASSSLVSGVAYAQYDVELKAFIPQPRIQDPNMWNYPGEDPGYRPGDAELYGGKCNLFVPVPDRVWSWFSGDGHSGYDGTYRVRARMTFKWDGFSIYDADTSNAAPIGTTHNYRLYKDALNREETCLLRSADAPSSDSTASRMSANSFRLGYASANPLVWGSPTIDGALEGYFSGSDLHLYYDTDDFPTNAFRVIRNGQVQYTNHVWDVSCLTERQLFGFDGFNRIRAGLYHPSPGQRSTVLTWGQSNRFDRSYSAVCSA